MTLSDIAIGSDRAQRGFCSIAEQMGLTARTLQNTAVGMHALLKTVSEGVVRFAERLRLQNQEFAILMPSLAARSWYFGMDMPLSSMSRMARLAASGDYGAVDAALADWHRRHSQAIIKRIAERFPDRSRVLTAALTAHQAGNYLLSIPAFLAQADGIAHDYLSEHFFRTGRWKQRLREFMHEANLTGFASVMAIPLSEPGLIRTPTNRLAEPAGILNRHQILHGLTSDYGTEMNSLKCIGLLDYLYSVGEMIVARKAPSNRVGIGADARRLEPAR